VAALDLDETAAERTAADLRGEGARVIGLGADVSDRAAIDKALEEVRGEFGPIEIMVTSAGLGWACPTPPPPSCAPMTSATSPVRSSA